MPVRYPILGGLYHLGLVEAASKIIDASGDTIVKADAEEAAVPYTMPQKLPDIKMPTPAMYDVPDVKGGRYHEPPRDLRKKKKAKPRQQKQSRRKR